MKTFLLGFILLLAGAQWAGAQSKQDSTLPRTYTKTEQELMISPKKNGSGWPTKM